MATVPRCMVALLPLTTKRIVVSFISGVVVRLRVLDLGTSRSRCCRRCRDHRTLFANIYFVTVAPSTCSLSATAECIDSASDRRSSWLFAGPLPMSVSARTCRYLVKQDENQTSFTGRERRHKVWVLAFLVAGLFDRQDPPVEQEEHAGAQRSDAALANDEDNGDAAAH